MAKRSKNRKRSPTATGNKPGPPVVIRPVTPEGTPWKSIVQALVIASAGLWIYWPVLHGDWLWDDNKYLADHPLIHDPARLWKIWFQPGSFIEYYPLEETLRWMQWHFFGEDTLGYHLTNVALHIVSALLVWRLLSKFGLRWAWLGGLLFAVHPVQVESVAWITEFKNALSLPPFLLAMGAWIDFEEHRRPREYGLAVGLFLMAMLCKSSVVMFPLVILLYAWWKRGRLEKRDFTATVPFALISVVLAATTILAGRWFLETHPMGSNPAPADVDFFMYLALVGWSLSFYFIQFFWPAGLEPLYSPWIVNPLPLAPILALPIFGAALGWFWVKRRTWGRHALLGLGFFIINLIPMIGLLCARYTYMMWSLDHMGYLSTIGLIGLVVAGMGRIEVKLPTVIRPYAIVGPGAVIIVLALASRGYAGVFLNAETLWTEVVKSSPELYLGHYNLGLALSQAGRTEEAMDQFRQTLRCKPDFDEARQNLENLQALQNTAPENTKSPR